MIWLIECLILTILTSTKYLQNLLKDGTSFVIFTVKKNSILGSLDNAKSAKRHLFFGHPIIHQNYRFTNTHTHLRWCTHFIQTNGDANQVFLLTFHDLVKLKGLLCHGLLAARVLRPQELT